MLRYLMRGLAIGTLVALAGCQVNLQRQTTSPLAATDTDTNTEGVEQATVQPAGKIASRALTLPATDQREALATLYWPESGCQQCPLVFFSHGAGLAPDGYQKLITQWVADGYVVVAALHTDSSQHPQREQYSGLDWVRTRVEDYALISKAVLSAKVSDGVSLSGQLFASGHSFGALIAQIAAGAELDSAVGVELAEDAPPPLAVVALSPPGPIENYITASGWSKISRPMLVVTGTEDVLPEFIPEWQLHTAAYQAAPAGTAYLLVFDDIDHYFNGAIGRPAEQGFVDNPAVTQLIDISLYFMRQVARDALPSAEQWRALSRPGLMVESR